MKQFILLFSLLSFVLFAPKAEAQCTFNNTLIGSLNPTAVGAGGAAQTNCAFGGDMYSVTVCAGATYTFSTCGVNGFDTELTLFAADGVTVLGFNDDACGNQSTITWTATYSGTAYILLDQWGLFFDCSHNTTCQRLTVTQTTACPTLASPSSCASGAIAVTCGTDLLDRSTIGGGNNMNSYSCHVDGTATPISTPGQDVVYAITVPAGQTTLNITMSGVVDDNDSYVELIFAGTTCATGCITSEQYDVALGQFGNGTNIFQVPAVGPGTFYLWIDSQNDGIYQYDISFDCFSSGIQFDNTSSCGGASGDLADGELNGLRPSVNGSTSNLNLTPCQTATICETVYLKNPTNFEWLDQITYNLGSCYTNVTAVTTGFAGVFQGGTWSGAYNGGTNAITWTFNHNAPNTTWGDGLGGSFTCQTYTDRFCFTTTISSTCNLASDLEIGIVATDDGVGGSGATVVGTTIATEDNLVLVPNPNAPTISNCPAAQTGSLDATCEHVLADYTGIPTVSDDCGTPVITQSPAIGTILAAGVHTITLTATDGSGNTASCNFQLTISDNTAPTISCPGNYTANAAAGVCTASVVTANPTFADNCGVTVLTWAMTGATTANSAATGINYVGTSTFNVGTTTVTYTARDANNNSITCSYTVTITDTQAPTITCPSNYSVNAGAGVCSASVATSNPTTADNCSISPLTWSMSGATTGNSAATGINNVGTSTFNVGTTTVTYTVTDPAGLTATCSFTVTVTDTQAPTITCPSNVSVNTAAGLCTASVNTTNPTTADNCSVTTLTWVMTGATTGNSPATGINNVGTQTFNSGVTTITYTVRDAAGLTATCSFTVTVTDNQNPVVTCPSNITTTTAAGLCTASVTTSNPTTSDNCGVSILTWAMTGATTGNSAATGINNLGTQTFNEGVTTVTYTVTDVNGRTSTCSFTVTVNDNQNPVLSGCPSNQNVSGNASCQFTLPNYTASVSATDNCGIASITQSPVAGTNITGSQVVTITATDVNGNTATCSFTLTVVDNTAPVITTCPPNTTGNVNASCLYTVPNFTGSVTVTDNCNGSGSITITQSPLAGTSLGIGTHTITINVTDPAGNNSNCSFTVTVTDNTAPSITCPGNQTIAADNNCQGFLPDYTTLATTSDNCSAVTVTQSPALGTTLTGAGTVQVVTLTATDASGNTSTCTFNVTLTDTNDPVVVSCPSNQNVSANASCQFVMADYTSSMTVTDNCSPAGSIVITQSPAAGATVSGTQTVTLTATDPSGNSTTCSFQVIVADNTVPTIVTCAPNTTGNVNASCQYLLPNYTSLVTATDNCTVASSLTVTQSPVAGTLVGIGTTVVTLTVSDANGNSSTCTFNVVVTDNTPPTLTCPGNQTIAANATCSGVLADYTTMASATDNCAGVVSITQSPVAGTTLSGAGTTQTVTLTATDANGNSSTCTFTVTLTDTSDPVFVTCPGNQNEAPDANCQFTLPDYTSLSSVTDNCGNVSTITISQSPIAGTVITGTTTITLTATDNTGNSAVCTFDVILADTTAPVVVNCPATQNVNANGSCSYTLTDFTSTITVTDNCGTGSITVTQTPAAGTVLSSGTTTVVLTVSDGTGNSTTCAFDVVVEDTTAPVITCGNTIQSCNPIVTFTTPVATDDCGIATVTQTDGTGLSSGSTFPIGTTTLEFTATDGAGNTSVCTFDVIIDATPDAAIASPDIAVCDTTDQVNISGNTPSNGTGTWVLLSGSGTFGDALSASTTLSGIPVGTTSIAWVISSGSCTPTSDTLNIVMATCFDIVIPTGFTPDGDGTNDVWEIPYLQLYHPTCRVEVYNRWGGKLFESDGYANPWDGTYKGDKLPIGAYYFVIDFNDGVSEPVKGTVTIIR